jgi:cell division transport system permease protein
VISRLTYTFRETWASFRRNMTLTVAAIITAAVSLLIFGLTLLMQRGFDNLVARWEGGVELIINVDNKASNDSRLEIEAALTAGQPALVEDFEWCDIQCSLADADRIYAGDPATRALLTADNIPSQYKVRPAEDTSVAQLRGMAEAFGQLPDVHSIVLAADQLEVIETLKGFVGLYTLALSIALLFAAILLIWNTIRTAMYARRREIEVMKLVGATDWFIRVPFMLEGLIQGLIGGGLAAGGLWFVNNRWTSGVKDFPEGSGLEALVVSDSFTFSRMLILLAIGMVAGAVGSGIAASRFLDV